MDKQKLIFGLNAVCEAESALHACNNMIELCRRESSNLAVLPYKPQKPQPHSIKRESFPATVYSFSDKAFSGGSVFFPVLIGSALLPLLGYILINPGIISSPEVFEEALDKALIPISIIAFVLAIVISILIIKARVRRDNAKEQQLAEDRYNEAVQYAEDTYRKAMADYNNAMAIYERKCQMQATAKSSLNTIEQKQYDIQRQIQSKLSTLYEALDIHPNFQNMVAAYQIRDYLSTGICDELTGPHGAYAQYMNDVRASRICDSIDQLRESMEESFSRLQDAVIGELSNIHGRLDNLSYDIQRGFNALHAQNAQNQQILERNFAIANQHLANIETCAAVTAHNQYIANRMRGIDAYYTTLL